MYEHPVPRHFPLAKWLLGWLVVLSIGHGFVDTVNKNGEESMAIRSVRAKDIHVGMKIVDGAHRYPINEVHVDQTEVAITYKVRGKFVHETVKRMHRVKVSTT